MFDAIIKQNVELVKWVKMSEIKLIKNIPFGVYAFTIPVSEKPKEWPFELINTVYIGLAGRGYADYAYDLKTRGKKAWKAGALYERADGHKQRLKNPWTKRSSEAYAVFQKTYGTNKFNDMYFCAMVPKTRHPDSGVRAWLGAYEQIMIYQYWYNFGVPPAMNSSNFVDYSGKNTVPGSFASKKRNTRSSYSLKDFVNG
jgi:hypothetical protein